jgi:multidrug efflux pump subunit AcrA (membrane-fusion protein)
MTVWRGQQLGELPDLSAMQARVYVLESEAAGLAQGLRAEVTLDAHPERTYAGSVASVQPIANPIEPESPVKYFETILALDETDGDVMRAGSRARAVIFVEERDAVLAVPNQALFHDDDGAYVYASNGGGFERRAVTLGARSVARTVVQSGLSAGDVVALVDPSATGR